MSASTLVRLLGAVEVLGEDGTSDDLGSVSQRRLLAMLAADSGRTLRADYLGDALGLSGGALRTGISRLRRRLVPGALQTFGGGYRLECAVDAVLFTAAVNGDRPRGDRLAELEEGLALWRGDALEEFRTEAWAQPEVLRLDELRALAIEECAAEMLRAGRGSEATALLRGHVVRWPLRDNLRGLLMRALAGDGRQVEALREYQDHRRHLIDVVGVEPSPELRTIERRIATGWNGADDLVGEGDGHDGNHDGDDGVADGVG